MTTPWFYLSHSILIGSGVLSLIYALYVIRFQKDKKWRIKRHRLCSGIGLLLIITGAASMILGKQIAGYSQFTTPHAYGGILALILLITTTIIGNLGMKGNKKLMNIHRIMGPVTGSLTILVALFGIITLARIL